MGQGRNSTKKKKWKQLSGKERYQIEALSQRGLAPSVIGKQLGRDRRTIEREITRGSVIQRDSEWRDRLKYCADAGQREHDERASGKGRGLKIGHDHGLARYIEQKIGKERMSPDAVIGEIKEKGIKFNTSICTKTVYNMIDKEILLNISNKDLPVKKDGKKRKQRQVRSVVLNNLKGRSSDERPEKVVFTPEGITEMKWREGETAHFHLKLFGFLSFGTHTIHVIEFDKSTYSVYTNEHNKSVPVWNHRINLEETCDGSTEYTDEVELYAGWKTDFVYWWSVLFYRHRQWKWVRLLSQL